MKKTLLSLGIIGISMSSIVTIVSCSDVKTKSINPEPGSVDPKIGTTNPEAKNTVPKTGTTPRVDSKSTSTKTSGTPILNDVNNLLSTQASKISDIEITDHNFLRVGGEDLTMWNGGLINLENEGGGDWSHSFAELRPNDYIDFVFANPSDIANFSKIVFYDNTLAAENIHAGSSMESIYFSKFVVQENKIVAFPEETGKFQSEGTAGDVSIYNLAAVKKNVVRMTFNNIYSSKNGHLDAQIIYLRGFSDVNNDGRVDFSDEQMTPTFAIDGGQMYQNYKQPYDAVKNYWHKGVTVAMHEQSIIDYLNKK